MDRQPGAEIQDSIVKNPLISTLCLDFLPPRRHSREGGNPDGGWLDWIPAFAGMTMEMKELEWGQVLSLMFFEVRRQEASMATGEKH